MTDDPDTAELENRIDKLESTIEKMMPSRRDALKMGGAALIGGAAMSGTASAGTNQVGTIGDKDATPPQLVDLHSEDINNADTVTTQTLNADAIDTESLDLTNLGFGVTNALLGAERIDSNEVALATQYTSGVSTSGKVIFDPDSVVVGNAEGFVACVNGKTGTSERFTDLGVSVRGTNGFDIAGSNDAGGAQTRNYDGLTDLDLAMSSGTYEVTVFGVVLETA